MKAVVRHSISSFLILLLLVGFGIGLHLVREKSKVTACRGICVSILDPQTRLVSEEEVLKYVADGCGAQVGKVLDSLDLAGIERVLDSRSAILSSQAWTTPDGMLNISVTQRKPAVRFLKGDGGGFYADRSCFLFPLHPTYTAPVLTVAGNLPVKAGSGFKGEAGSAYEKEWIARVVEMSDDIAASEWAGKIDSIYVAKDERLSFLLESGETVLMGPVGDTPDKLARLSTYIGKIRNGEYRTVNLEFDGQIICRH